MINIKDLIKEYQQAIDFEKKYCNSFYANGGAEEALLLLLEQFKDELDYDIDESFQKSFRNTDGIEPRWMNRVFWHLLNAAPVFWKVFDKMLEEDETNEDK